MTTKRDENDNKYSKGLDPLSHMHGRQPSGRMDHGRFSIFQWLWIAYKENNKSKSVLSCCYESLHCSKVFQLLPYLALCTAGGFIFNKNLQHYLARRSTMKSTTVKEQFFLCLWLHHETHYDGDKMVTVRVTVSRDKNKILKSRRQQSTRQNQYNIQL